MHRIRPLPGVQGAWSGSRSQTSNTLPVLWGVRGCRLLPLQYLWRYRVERSERSRQVTPAPRPRAILKKT